MTAIDIHRSRPTVATGPTTLTDGHLSVRLAFTAELLAARHGEVRDVAYRDLVRPVRCHVLSQAVAAGHDVTVFVRTPAKLSPDLRERVSVQTGDLSAHVPLDLIRGQDALINCAGHVADGDAFVDLIDRLVTHVDSLP